MLSIYPEASEVKSQFFKIIQKMIDREILPFSSARAAIVWGLNLAGINRIDEILIPKYLGHCVISAIAKTSFPVQRVSNSVKAILVYHQFGFPQNLNYISKIAKQNNWLIVNDCANTIFSRYRDKLVVTWGDFSVLSLSKIFPCILGGAFINNNEKYNNITLYNKLSDKYKCEVNIARKILENSKIKKEKVSFQVESVYGYISEIISFPEESYKHLPKTKKQVQDDIKHRKKIYDIICSFFPENVPVCSDSDVVPFAVPIKFKEDLLCKIEKSLTLNSQIDIPVLNFDFNMNLLKPKYQKSLIIGCHQGWSEQIVLDICKNIWDIVHAS